MTKREELQERYEDALVALMMDELAQVEGRKALEENERLKNDSEFSVPSAAEQRCLRLISSYFVKQSFSHAAHIVSKAAAKAAVVVLIRTFFVYICICSIRGSQNTYLELDCYSI